MSYTCIYSIYTIDWKSKIGKFVFFISQRGRYGSPRVSESFLSQKHRLVFSSLNRLLRSQTDFYFIHCNEFPRIQLFMVWKKKTKFFSIYFYLFVHWSTLIWCWGIFYILDPFFNIFPKKKTCFLNKPIHLRLYTISHCIFLSNLDNSILFTIL